MEDDKFIAERLLEVISDGEGGFQELVSLVRKDRRQKAQLTEKDTRIAELEKLTDKYDSSCFSLAAKVGKLEDKNANLEAENTRMREEKDQYFAYLDELAVQYNKSRAPARFMKIALPILEKFWHPEKDVSPEVKYGHATTILKSLNQSGGRRMKDSDGIIHKKKWYKEEGKPYLGTVCGRNMFDEAFIDTKEPVTCEKCKELDNG